MSEIIASALEVEMKPDASRSVAW
eukprot:SAG25_NODE_14510_length_254_cov_0.670968_2_plen_23_part_01